MLAPHRALGPLLLLAASASAPYQCASRPGPERRLEVEPAEALYDLAQKFKAEGNTKAQAETLQYIVDKFPASRFAVAAKQELGDVPAK